MFKILVLFGLLISLEISAKSVPLKKMPLKKLVLLLHSKVDITLVGASPGWSSTQQSDLETKHFCPGCSDEEKAKKKCIARNKYFYNNPPGVTNENTVFVTALDLSEYEVGPNVNTETTWISTNYVQTWNCKNIPTKPDGKGDWDESGIECKLHNGLCKAGPFASSNAHLFHGEIVCN